MPTPDLPALVSQITGCWSLHSCTATSLRDPTNIAHPSGENPKGTIMYTPDGYMSADLLSLGQAPYASSVLGEATNAECAESARRYNSYSGPYHVEVDAEGRPVLVHRVYVSLSPGFMGVGQRRLVSVQGDEMVLRPDKAMDFEGEKRDIKVVWKRMPKNDPLSSGK